MTKTVLIVGGGPAGVMTAKALMKNNAASNTESFTVTIVDRQNYTDWSLASPRSVVKPGDVTEFGYCFPLDKVCEFVGCSFQQGAVQSIGKDSVILADGTVLPADCIVVAIGGQYASGALWKPLPEQDTVEKRIAAFEAENARIKAASNIVIAGAGATGVEVAGEIKSAFGDKNVTLVGSVLTNATEYIRKNVKNTLEKMGVAFKEGRVEAASPIDGKVTTTNGETLDCDLLLNTAGFAYQGKALADASIEGSVTDRGQFTCKPTLQLQSCDTVFAVGDVVEVPQGKYADVKGIAHAEATSIIVGYNIAQMLLFDEAKLKDFAWSDKPVLKPMMTCLGPAHAVGDLGLPFPLGNLLGRKLKCKDYYMSIQAKNFGKGKTW